MKIFSQTKFFSKILKNNLIDKNCFFSRVNFTKLHNSVAKSLCTKSPIKINDNEEIVIKISNEKNSEIQAENNKLIENVYLNFLDDDLKNFLIDYKKNNEMVISTEKSQIYNSLIETHKNFKIPFVDHNFYMKLLDMSKSIIQNEELDSWYILDQYIELNIEKIKKEFFIDALQGFGKIKYFKFKFWYYCENKVMVQYKNYSNEELAKVVYSFSFAGKGSDYFYKMIAIELMKRKISNLSDDEFILVYNSYKFVKINDTIFNLILEKARLEKFNYL